MTIKAIQHSSQLPLVGPNFLLDHSLSPMVYPQSSFHPDPRWHVTCQSLPISNTYWSDMRPMCLDAPQCINPILNVSFGQVQQRAVWPNGYQASNTIPIDGSSTAFPFFAAGSSYYPHDIACPSSSCIPPMHDPAPSMSNYPFQPSSQSFHDIPAVSATIDMNFVPTTKNLATNEAKLQGPYNPLSEQTFGTLFQNGDLSQFQVGTGRSLYFEQVAQQSDNDNILTNITGGGCRAAQFTFQCPPPTQNTEPPVPDAPSGEIQLGTRKYFPLQRAPQQPEHNKRSHHQTHEQTSETAPTGPEDTSTPAHICSAIPGSACNHGTAICLEILHLYVVENPGVLSNQKIGSLVTTATVLPLDSGQFVLGSRDDTSNDTIFSPHGATSQKVALLSSNTVASFLALSLPGRSCFSPLNTFGATAAFLSKRTASSSTSKKRQCTEDQECPRKQRRKCSMAMKQTTDEDMKPPGEKKSQLPLNMEWVCLICKILGKGHITFSQDDSLKCHMKLHAIFLILFREKYTALFRLLQPRVKNQVEDLCLLVVTGLSLQAQACERGVPIKDKEDLREIHPDMAKIMQMSLP